MYVHGNTRIETERVIDIKDDEKVYRRCKVLVQNTREYQNRGRTFNYKDREDSSYRKDGVRTFDFQCISLIEQKWVDGKSNNLWGSVCIQIERSTG